MGATFTVRVCDRSLLWKDPAYAVQEGMYANFAGRDASRGMAKQSFDEGPFEPMGVTRADSWHSDMLTELDQPLDKLQDLTPSEV